MKKLEITTGLIIHDKPVHTVFEGVVISSCHMANGNGEYLCKMYGEDEAQCRANAELTADAFNTYQECELLPSELLKQANQREKELDIALKEREELLKQNKELREALDNLVKAVPNDGTWNHQAAWDKAYRILNTPII